MAMETATIGGGCFWCIEGALRHLDGVTRAESGYAGGHVENPSYEEVCAKRTGHAEVVQIDFDPAKLSYAELHNAGVEASKAGRQPEAEGWFSEAIRRQPDSAISWVARGISRNEQGNVEAAAADFNYAATLYRAQGEESESRQLERAAVSLVQPEKKKPGGTGMGSQMLSGALAVIQFLGPIAVKAFVPMGI